jgi:hypothetical protein
VLTGQSYDQHPNHSGTIPQQQTCQQNGYPCNSHASGHHLAQQYNAPHHWHAVPRPWASAYPDDRYVAASHSSANGPSFPLNSSYYSHGYLPTAPPTRTNQGGHTPSSEDTDANRPRLTLSNLQQLDRDRRSTDNMAIWRAEDQREGAWNGVGYVCYTRDDRRRKP